MIRLPERKAAASRPVAGIRRGVTMPELIVTLLVVMIIGAALTRLLVYQSRFFDAQRMGRDARTVSRGALNVLLSELRMVAVPGGVISATTDKVVVRVPYAWGVLCGSTAGGSTVSLAPMDSLAYAEAGVRGYAWRDSTGNYTYQNAAFTLAPGLAADCVASSITTLPGGKIVTVTPVFPAAAALGNPMFLYRLIEYEFKESVAMPGRRALWRKNVATNTSEELIAPFEAAAGFQFYVNGLAAPQAAPPGVIGELRGLELRLHGESDRPALATASPTTAEFQTAVFFMNRAP
jgi:hypothetical protein